MRILPVNLKRHLTALGLCLLLPIPALAADADISHLMDELRGATEAEAPRAARNVAREWSKSGSASMDLLLKRGREAFEKGDYQLAIDHLTALTDHAPSFAEGYHARAMAYHAANLYGPAIDDLEHALALNPQHFNAIFGLAALFHEFGDLRRAATLYRKVLVLHPHHEDAARALDALRRDGIGRTL